MKKKNIILLLLSVIAASSCNDDDKIGEQYTKESAVKIIRSDLSFSAQESAGSVSFEAPSQATAHVNSSWATAVVNGNQVQVNVGRNAKLEGRSALLTIKCGNDSANVSIHQNGMVFKYRGENSFTYNDQARTLTLPINNQGSNLSMSVPDWATATITDEAMTINLTENNSGHVRSGYFYYQAGPYVDSLYIKQGELKDIVNKNYFFAGYDLKKITSNTQDISELLNAYNATILESNDQLFMYLPDNDLSLPLVFNDDDLSVDICSGQYMGTYYNRYHIFSSIIDSNWYNAFSQANYNMFFSLPFEPYFRMTACFDYDNERQVMMAHFVNKPGNTELLQSLFGDSSLTFDADVIAFSAYTNAEVNDANYSSDLMLFIYPFLNEYKGSFSVSALRSLPVDSRLKTRSFASIKR